MGFSDYEKNKILVSVEGGLLVDGKSRAKAAATIKTENYPTLVARKTLEALQTGRTSSSAPNPSSLPRSEPSKDLFQCDCGLVTYIYAHRDHEWKCASCLQTWVTENGRTSKLAPDSLQNIAVTNPGPGYSVPPRVTVGVLPAADKAPLSSTDMYMSAQDAFYAGVNRDPKAEALKDITKQLETALAPSANEKNTEKQRKAIQSVIAVKTREWSVTGFPMYKRPSIVEALIDISNEFLKNTGRHLASVKLDSSTFQDLEFELGPRVQYCRGEPRGDGNNTYFLSRGIVLGDLKVLLDEPIYTSRAVLKKPAPNLAYELFTDAVGYRAKLKAEIPAGVTDFSKTSDARQRIDRVVSVMWTLPEYAHIRKIAEEQAARIAERR